MAWYVARDGQTWGPLELGELKQAARDGKLQRDDLVWQQGMHSWRPASAMADIWQPPGSDADALSAAAPNEGTRAPRRRSNFALRHWRGEFSLRTAYWLFGFVGVLASLAILKVIADVAPVPERAVGAYIATLAVAVLVLSIWQVVGVWRSSERYVRAGGRRNWAGLAKVGALFGALQLAIGSYSILAPLALERREPKPTPQVQAERIRLLPARAEIEISGQLSFGMSITFGQFMTAEPNVKWVRSDVRGGVLDEAVAIASLIRQHGLDTYTSVDCQGACALIFLAGAKRFLTPDARLGFYDTSIDDPDQSPRVKGRRSVVEALRSLNAPSWFVENAAKASPSSPWRPSREVLARVGIVTGVIDAATLSGATSIETGK